MSVPKSAESNPLLRLFDYLRDTGIAYQLKQFRGNTWSKDTAIRIYNTEHTVGRLEKSLDTDMSRYVI